MQNIQLPFVPGQLVGIYGFTSPGIVSEVRISGGLNYTFFLISPWTNELIGSFEANELYNLEDY